MRKISIFLLILCQRISESGTNHSRTVKKEKPPLENWQKSYENGEYLRSVEITEEQNYNMIDGRMNNLPSKPRKIGQRISVLDRLHLKFEEQFSKFRLYIFWLREF